MRPGLPDDPCGSSVASFCAGSTPMPPDSLPGSHAYLPHASVVGAELAIVKSGFRGEGDRCASHGLTSGAGPSPRTARHPPGKTVIRIRPYPALRTCAGATRFGRHPNGAIPRGTGVPCERRGDGRYVFRLHRVPSERIAAIKAARANGTARSGTRARNRRRPAPRLRPERMVGTQLNGMRSARAMRSQSRKAYAPRSVACVSGAPGFFQRDAQQKRSPVNAPAEPSQPGIDFVRREIGIGRREVEPELDRAMRRNGTVQPRLTRCIACHGTFTGARRRPVGHDGEAAGAGQTNCPTA